MRATSIGDRKNPYAIIAEFWGEDLDAQLLQRIIHAPERHLEEFRDFYYLDIPLSTLPELLPGRLRPILKDGPVDTLYDPDRPELSLANHAITALLYAHEIVMDDLGLYLATGDQLTQESIGRWLIAVRPLFEDGSLHFKPVASAARHPSMQTIRDHSSVLDKVLTPTGSPYADHLVQWLPLDGIEADERKSIYKLITGQFLRDLTSFTAYSQLWDHQVNRLLRTEAEHILLEFALRDQPSIDGRELALLKLMALSVPRLSPNIRALVDIRRSESSFADLRRDVASALGRVIIPDSMDLQCLTDVRHALAEELEPSRRRLEAATKRSPALEALRTGASGFGISAIAATAGFVAGGSLISALSSAAATKTIDAGFKFRNLKRERNRDRALSDLVVSLISLPDIRDSP